MAVTIDEFILIAGVKKETVIKNRNDIPGLSYKKGEFSILSGTRYPAYYKNKIKTMDDRRFLLLRAINEYKYIDYLKLRLYHEQFIEMLRDLLSAGLIRENNMENKYGANAYDITDLGAEVISNKNSIKRITELIASATGHFAGAIISEIAA